MNDSMEDALTVVVLSSSPKTFHKRKLSAMTNLNAHDIVASEYDALYAPQSDDAVNSTLPI